MAWTGTPLVQSTVDIFIIPYAAQKVAEERNCTMSNENTCNDLAHKLVDKSQEAFIVGIELYNKPTIKYRVEGFSFFICNAWELLLKAHMIQTLGMDSIYYSDSHQTKSLSVCIKQIFTNDKDPLRKNLEKIIDLRNTSTHFITEEFEQIYVPLFQSCVLNYINKLLQFFDIDITDCLGSNFLTLSVKINELTPESVSARYPKEMAGKIIKAMTSVGKDISKIDNPKYAIPVRHDYYITKNKKQATASFSITKDAEQAAFIIKELHDMQASCPYRTSDCVDIINRKIKKSIPNFINPSPKDEGKRHVFNSYIFNLFVNFYDLKHKDNYCYRYNNGNIHYFSYSQKTIDLIIDAIRKDPEHIVQSLKDKLGKSTPGAKEF